MHDVFIHPSGQDDNLGDSALRAGLLTALNNPSYRFHVYLEGQTSDYLSGIPLSARDALYSDRGAWVSALRGSPHPAYLLNAGEINPQAGRSFPSAGPIREMRRSLDDGGVVIATGIGLKDPSAAQYVTFDRSLRSADVMSWRDRGSQQAAGFGAAAPDWAFVLGSDPASWTPIANRGLVAVTLRFDRPWPGEGWLDAVRELAARTSTHIVTVAQVARDAPRAVHLAEALDGEYLVARSTRHDDLDDHVRAVYARSLAVVSDRAHALIMGATEGAYPLGTGSDPNKIIRLLETVNLGTLTGDLAGFSSRAAHLENELGSLPAAIGAARSELAGLSARIHDAIATSASISRGN